MTRIREYKVQWIVWAGLLVLAPGVTASAAPTDNAALLYYQAALLYEKPDDATASLLTSFSDWEIPSNSTVREFVEKNRRVIGYVVTAANLPHCDWAYDYSQGFDLALPNLPSIPRLVRLMAADARLIAQEGDYQTALDRCLSLHKMGLHAVDGTVITYLVGLATSGRANKAIQEILAIVPADVQLLSQLKVQLCQFQSAYPSVAWVITQEGQVSAATIRKDEMPTLVRMIKACGDSPEYEAMMERVRQADDAFFDRNRKHWLNSIAAVVATLESGLPYERMRARLEEQTKQLSDEAKSNPDATMTSFGLPAAHRIYVLAVRQQTQFNAVRTALDLYLTQATTRRLPDTLPADAPGDLFSGKPFVYEKATDHFTLRCQVKEDAEKAEPGKYEFKIKH